MEFDELLVKRCGQFGRYQTIYLLFMSLAIMPYSMSFMSIVFIFGTPKHWCTLPPNISHEALGNLSSSRGECKMYDIDYGNTSLVASLRNTSALNEVSCKHGWSYDDSVYTSTIVSEWNLVCDRLPLKNLAESLGISVGKIFGAVVWGFLADRFGRKLILIIVVIMAAVATELSAFSPNIFVFMAIRVLQTVSEPFCIATVLVVEIVGPLCRPISVVLALYWSLGYGLLALLAYLIRDWRMLLHIIPLAFIPFICCIWFLPESPRWLYSRGRHAEAGRIMKRISKKNLKAEDPSEEEIFGTNVVVKERPKSSVPIRSLCKCNVMLLWICCFALIWFVAGLVYLGISLYVTNLSGDLYLNHFLSAMSEMPGMVLFWFLIRFSRRYSMFSSLAISGVSLIILPWIPEQYNSIVIALAMIGKSAISGTWVIVYVHAAEVFPTSMRNSLINFCFTFANVGGAVGPFIVDLGSYTGIKEMPVLVFGGFAIIAGLSCLLLPETRGNKLPDTLTESIKLKKLNKLTSSL